MLAADPIRGATHTNRNRRQSISLRFVIRFDASQRKKLLLRESQLTRIRNTKHTGHERRVEFVVTSCDRRVRGENALSPNDGYSFGPTATFGLDNFSRQLQSDKRRVAFLYVQHMRSYAKRANQTK